MMRVPRLVPQNDLVLDVENYAAFELEVVKLAFNSREISSRGRSEAVTPIIAYGMFFLYVRMRSIEILALVVYLPFTIAWSISSCRARKLMSFVDRKVACRTCLPAPRSIPRGS